MRFDAPLELLGDHDGALNVATVLGNFFEPTDWAPDVGHGTIEPFRDAPWMSVDPATGSAEPGESDAVTVTLGGEAVAPGTYEGELVVIGNDAHAAGSGPGHLGGDAPGELRVPLRHRHRQPQRCTGRRSHAGPRVGSTVVCDERRRWDLPLVRTGGHVGPRGSRPTATSPARSTPRSRLGWRPPWTWSWTRRCRWPSSRVARSSSHWRPVRPARRTPPSATPDSSTSSSRSPRSTAPWRSEHSRAGDPEG